MPTALRIQIFTAAFFAFAAVLLGALGAHALEPKLMERDMVSAWRTASLYHIAHALALFALGIWGSTKTLPAVARWTFWLWAAGIVCFSGSIYILALGGPSFLGPVTPLGGLLFLSGWVAICAGVWKIK
ncbi:MAG TPA: DUF423 domain-containing protein [Opitutales bacterium]|nr:DUF423 domain-containing protein [Opitutales bacterium]